MFRAPGIAAPLVLVVLALAAPHVASAQSGKRPYRVGVLHPAFVRTIPTVEGLQAGLRF